MKEMLREDIIVCLENKVSLFQGGCIKDKLDE